MSTYAIADAINGFAKSFTKVMNEKNKIEREKLEFEKLKEQLTTESIQDILNQYFDVPKDTYAYNLTRDKNAFFTGTMGFDDFEEFDEDTTRDLAEYIIEKLNI